LEFFDGFGQCSVIELRISIGIVVGDSDFGVQALANNCDLGMTNTRLECRSLGNDDALALLRAAKCDQLLPQGLELWVLRVIGTQMFRRIVCLRDFLDDIVGVGNAQGRVEITADFGWHDTAATCIAGIRQDGAAHFQFEIGEPRGWQLAVFRALIAFRQAVVSSTQSEIGCFLNFSDNGPGFFRQAVFVDPDQLRRMVGVEFNERAMMALLSLVGLFEGSCEPFLHLE